LSTGLQLSSQLASKKGASSWLSTLPLESHGFVLHKVDFCEEIALRYGWSPLNLPATVTVSVVDLKNMLLVVQMELSLP